MRLTLAGVILFVCCLAHGQDNIYLAPEKEKWTTSIFVLFEQGVAPKSDILTAFGENRRSDIAIEQLRDTDIKRAYDILPTLKAGSEIGGESARDRLGRYIVLGTKSKASAERIAKSLATRDDVLYVTIGTEPHIAAGCPTGASDPDLVPVSESKTWGFSMVRAASAWNYARGHSYIGIADFGGERS